MTLHSQTPFSAERHREFVVPAAPIQQYTPEESRRLEDWWIAKMPGAGKARGKKKQTRCHAHVRPVLTQALQTWVTREKLIELVDGNSNAVTGYFSARYRQDFIEFKREDGDNYYRLSRQAKKFGFRFPDVDGLILSGTDNWITAKDLAASLGVHPGYIKVDLTRLANSGALSRRVTREPIKGNKIYEYIRAEAV